ncbi:peptidylprolyl isomerase [Nocardioides phosphati]|uniref:Peptidyl-prolyl cis-trans isomerase n=1 Tax=Nocardioides phosphati TaxID=1867775 RepID=A0ABQ2NBR1_9ACTN|nr:FKBP-type peptidyl-prolyl cis-trans isomerase [Nocardioides phosphati]GGO91842.1 peptidylprolyl isomerase [Nocardioides phosphati]
MRRLVVTSTVLALSTAGLAACGSGDDSHLTGKVTVSGDFGKQPTVKYSGKVSTDKTIIKVLHKGTGATVAEGDSVTVNMYIGNGYDGKKALSTFDEGQSPSPVDVSKSTLPAIEKALKGQKIGSRVEVIAAPKDTWASQGGNAQLNIGNDDTTVWVIDLVKKAPKPLTGPQGKTLPTPAGAPKLKLTKGVPSGFDFTGMAPVGKTTKVYTLIKGSGPALKVGQNVKMDYLGQVVKGKVFDGSYAADRQPLDLPKPLGQGGVIQGWDKGLVGVTVGSRVILVIPSAEGYGAQGQGADIPPNADLVFVVDILAAN